MYPSLTSIGSRSRWYLKKQTAQEATDEIADLEEKLAEKRQNDIQVGITIQIRGRAALPIKVTGLVEKDEDEDEEANVSRQPQDTMEEDMVEQDAQDLDDERIEPRMDSASNMDQYDDEMDLLGSPPYNSIFGSDSP